MPASTTHIAMIVALSVAAPALAQEDEKIARGEYLVTTSGCHDCHTPFTMGANGPEPDMTRALSGHPQDLVIETPAELQEPWAVAANATNTAHSGPWGGQLHRQSHV